MNIIDKKSILQKLEQRIESLKYLIDNDTEINKESVRSALGQIEWVKNEIKLGKFDCVIWD